MGRTPWSLSVDLMDRASLRVLTRIGDNNAAARGPNRSFYSWAVLIGADVEHIGARVEATPTPRNPFHADIQLPAHGDDEAARLDARREYARDLAALARLQAPARG